MLELITKICNICTYSGQYFTHHRLSIVIGHSNYNNKLISKGLLFFIHPVWSTMRLKRDVLYIIINSPALYAFKSYEY